ncbi:MAG TPA: peptidoglycan DD-metalloendopeptidase family protein [Candidatus Saccharicenans sp.]|jgi:murein DD-endopeptidase MepM/ murein hydrolase activator NlpD|nr:peptidoglycan DD-metalloendopeptidase family protein [Candidatus Saccharicenans sp.]
MNRRKVRRVALFFSLVAAIVLILFFSITDRKQKPEAKAQPADVILNEVPVTTEKITVLSGQTITDLLTARGFTVSQVLDIRNQIKPVYDLARIPAGRELRLLKKEDRFIGLQLDLDAERYLDINLKEGQAVARIINYPIEKKLVLMEGVIEDSLISAVNKAGEQDLLALMLADIFGWEIDFYIDLRKGDVFRLLVEKKYINGHFGSYEQILAACFLNQGRLFEAFRFTFPDSGQTDYFDSKGNSLRREFLKSPLKYTRISSRFSLNRLHPIRKIYRPHYGVDFAAPVGTPVQATADGVVTFAGWNGGAGRMVKIKHKRSYETMYLHLSRLGPGIQQGVRVRSGQIIGYVGSSGESTGPHLDYRLIYHGQYVNPLSWKFQPAEPLKEKYRGEFNQQVTNSQQLLFFPLPLFKYN